MRLPPQVLAIALLSSLSLMDRADYLNRSAPHSMRFSSLTKAERKRRDAKRKQAFKAKMRNKR